MIKSHWGHLWSVWIIQAFLFSSVHNNMQVSQQRKFPYVAPSRVLFLLHMQTLNEGIIQP